MSYNRLGTLSAGLLGLGWLVAVSVNLFVWFPQIQEMGPGFWDDYTLFFTFVRENVITWRLFHVGTTVGLLAAVFLVPLLAEKLEVDNRNRAFTTIGIVGAVFGLIASLIDQFATPVAARFAAGNPIYVAQIWEYMEPFRDSGLKTIAFWLMGFWLLWVAAVWLNRSAYRLGRFTQIVGIALLLLALVETLAPPPLVYQIGETGIGGLVLLLLPVWGLWLARWFWQAEVAAVLGESSQEAGEQ